MSVRKRALALAAGVLVALGSIFVVASPAAAAPTCTSSKLSDGSGYYFSCYNSTTQGVWLQISCATYAGSHRTIRYEYRPVGYPWSIGKTLQCSSWEFAAAAVWGPL